MLLKSIKNIFLSSFLKYKITVEISNLIGLTVGVMYIKICQDQND